MREGRRDSFGARLRQLREAAGLTQEQLAERAGLSANAIGALERGERRRPYQHTIQALAEALGLSAEEGAALAEAVPPLDRTPSPALERDPAASLPTPLTRLVGRERDAAAVIERLTESTARLVTLTGPGGVGKTRLALQVATEVGDDFPDGVAFVSLAPLADAALVIPAIASAVGIREAGGQDLVDALRGFLRRRRLLLVLDNVEHLLPAAPEVAALLAACPGLRVLATSRAPLHVRGEQEYPVQPLGLPDLSQVPTPEEAATSPAVQLFVERAREMVPGFALSRTNAAAVAAICRRLEGLPLALELAAAWVKLLSPTALLARLDRALPLLAGGARDLPDRQRTMELTIGWSYDLLTPPAQAMFRRLAVFAGGWTLAAAEALQPEPRMPADEVLGLLAGLVEQSLVVVEPGDAGRYRLLEPVRQYAGQRLDDHGETAATRQRHAEWCLALAEEAEATLGSAGADARWLDRLEADHDNLRGALTWLLESGAADTALRLAAALWPFWHYHSHLSEGRRWLREVLATAPDAPVATRARALLGAAFLANYQGDDCQADSLVSEALVLAGGLRDTTAVIPRHRVYLLALLARGIMAEDRGDYAEAVPPLAEANELARASGDRTWTAVTLLHLGIVAYGQGDADLATARLADALAGFRALPDFWGAANALDYLGLVAGERGDLQRAATLHAESLALFQTIGTRDGLAGGLANVAALMAKVGQHETAARLFGAAEGLAEQVGSLPKLPERAAHERALAAARAALDRSLFAVAYDAGRAQPVEQAIAEAMACSTQLAAAPAEAPPPTHPYPAGLSEREVEVLRLVAQGLTNPQVAERLFLSPRTIDAHLQRIFGKLDVPNRGAAIRYAVEHGLI